MACVSALGLHLGPPALAQKEQVPLVRLEDLEIDPSRLDGFESAAREQAVVTIRKERGVLALHAAAEKDNPARVRIFGVYTDENAYRAHLQTPHFQGFRSDTDKMVLDRAMYDAVPIVLGAKPRLPAKALVRVAELEIDPAQLEAYKAAVTEEIETSIRIETGVLAIYSVALKENPTQLRFFEIYADEKAYRQHLESPHFKKYVDVTRSMITARRLFEMKPLSLSAKPREAGSTRRQ